MNFIKGNVEKEFSTIVFVGNGAIENGFAPLRDAVDSWIKRDPSPDVIKKLRSLNTETFHQLALLSYKFRLNRGVLFNKYFKDASSCNEQDVMRFIEGTQIQSFLQFRKDIADNFKKSANLKLRYDEKIKEIIGPDALFITTNWDNTLWNNDDIQNLIHLHGRCDWDDSVVFPTELLIEDSAYELLPVYNKLEKFSHQNGELILKIFRYRALNNLFQALITSSNRLKNAKKIVIWGYALGDYDADVNALIGSWNQDSKTNELCIVNPDAYSLKRAIALTGCENARLYDPVLKLIHELKNE